MWVDTSGSLVALPRTAEERAACYTELDALFDEARRRWRRSIPDPAIIKARRLLDLEELPLDIAAEEMQRLGSWSYRAYWAAEEDEKDGRQRLLRRFLG